MLQTPKFTQSAQTQLMYDLFMQASSPQGNGVVTYLDLKKASGGLTREELRSSIQTVRRRMLADHNVVWECEANFGYRVVPNNALSEVGLKAIERSRRQVRSGIKAMDTADVAKLTVFERGEYFVRKTLAQMLYKASNTTVRKNIEQMVHKTHNELTSEEQITAIKDALARKT